MFDAPERSWAYDIWEMSDKETLRLSGPSLSPEAIQHNVDIEKETPL